MMNNSRMKAIALACSLYLIRPGIYAKDIHWANLISRISVQRIAGNQGGGTAAAAETGQIPKAPLQEKIPGDDWFGIASWA